MAMPGVRIGSPPTSPRVPSTGFEPAHPAPEADALSPELRGRDPDSILTALPPPPLRVVPPPRPHAVAMPSVQAPLAAAVAPALATLGVAVNPADVGLER